MKLTKADLDRICCACSSTQGIFNVRCYGAKGDGETDDLDAILTARDAVNTAGGGVLFFPRGCFIVCGTIELGANTTVRGLGAGSVLKAKPRVTSFNMLLVRDSNDVRVRDLVLDGNKAETKPPADPEDENLGCGFFGRPVDDGQTGLSIKNVIVRNHHGSGIRIIGPRNSEDPYKLKANEIEVIGCQILHCGGRGVIFNRVTRARIAGNIIKCCTQAGIQFVLSRSVVIDGNVIERTAQKTGTHGGHGIGAANSLDYVIVNNLASENERWGIAASAGVGLWPEEGFRMSQRYVVANNVCRGNVEGGITIDPTTPPPGDDPEAPTPIQDSFATVACNICVDNRGAGIHTTHAGYLAVYGNICDLNDNAGISIVSSRNAVVAGNVLTGNSNGVGFFTGAGVQDVGDHLLGGNVYYNNGAGEIQFGPGHPAIRQLQDRWPREGDGGMNLPVKDSAGDPANPVEGLLYVNIEEDMLRVYADGAWRTLQSTSGKSW